jgi:hypothetical protein
VPILRDVDKLVESHESQSSNEDLMDLEAAKYLSRLKLRLRMRHLKRYDASAPRR